MLTWRLRRLLALNVSGVPNVIIVALFGLVFLPRPTLFSTNRGGADLEVYCRTSNSWIAASSPYLFDRYSSVGTYRYAPWFALLWMPFANLPRFPSKPAP